MNEEISPANEHLAAGADDMAPDMIGPPARKRVAPKVITTLHLSSRTCKWPIGDPTKSDFHYCGKPPQSGRPYCDTHDGMSYQSPARRRSS